MHLVHASASWIHFLVSRIMIMTYTAFLINIFLLLVPQLRHLRIVTHYTRGCRKAHFSDYEMFSCDFLQNYHVCGAPKPERVYHRGGGGLNV